MPLFASLHPFNAPLRSVLFCRSGRVPDLCLHLGLPLFPLVHSIHSQSIFWLAGAGTAPEPASGTCHAPGLCPASSHELRLAGVAPEPVPEPVTSPAVGLYSFFMVAFGGFCLFLFLLRKGESKKKKKILNGRLFENSIRDKESGFIKPWWREAPEPGSLNANYS